jgi:hypothetical protein
MHSKLQMTQLLKTEISYDVMLYHLVEGGEMYCRHALLVTCLLSLHFDPKDGGIMFL